MGNLLEADALYEPLHEYLFPRTKEQLARARARAVQMDGEEPPGGFTCDACSAVSTCKFAFDWYNTNGDCVGEK